MRLVVKRLFPLEVEPLEKQGKEGLPAWNSLADKDLKWTMDHIVPEMLKDKSISIKNRRKIATIFNLVFAEPEKPEVPNTEEKVSNLRMDKLEIKEHEESLTMEKKMEVVVEMGTRDGTATVVPTQDKCAVKKAFDQATQTTPTNYEGANQLQMENKADDVGTDSTAQTPTTGLSNANKMPLIERPKATTQKGRNTRNAIPRGEFISFVQQHLVIFDDSAFRSASAHLIRLRDSIHPFSVYSRDERIELNKWLSILLQQIELIIVTSCTQNPNEPQKEVTIVASKLEGFKKSLSKYGFEVSTRQQSTWVPEDKKGRKLYVNYEAFSTAIMEIIKGIGRV